MGGNELRTPLEMALKREAEGELAGGCIKCDYCVVVQGSHTAASAERCCCLSSSTPRYAVKNGRRR